MMMNDFTYIVGRHKLMWSVNISLHYWGNNMMGRHFQISIKYDLLFIYEKKYIFVSGGKWKMEIKGLQSSNFMTYIFLYIN